MKHQIRDKRKLDTIERPFLGNKEPTSPQEKRAIKRGAKQSEAQQWSKDYVDDIMKEKDKQIEKLEIENEKLRQLLFRALNSLGASNLELSTKICAVLEQK
jgi:hypothetical protein